MVFIELSHWSGWVPARTRPLAGSVDRRTCSALSTPGAASAVAIRWRWAAVAKVDSCAFQACASRVMVMRRSASPGWPLPTTRDPNTTLRSCAVTSLARDSDTIVVRSRVMAASADSAGTSVAKSRIDLIRTP